MGVSQCTTGVLGVPIPPCRHRIPRTPHPCSPNPSRTWQPCNARPTQLAQIRRSRLAPSPRQRVVRTAQLCLGVYIRPGAWAKPAG
ncbi:hypothetical protein EJ04DRAFT_513610 [Polyplosphaeria fusca]|uniref:Uncharacterized protein n=1 Tax=Polyplosphaeria fusca TaxID=682080 RepID=A0A9P4QS84_9PLEO|nr:hypothetical protein EJ04DRAFT_513610 [Polyplosphaeria fusca]